MSLEEDIRKKFGKMQEISKERLHPPMAPKEYIASLNDPKAFEGINLGEVSRPRKHEPIASETEVSNRTSMAAVVYEQQIGKDVEKSDSKLAIDFSYLANNSSFQRGIMEFIKKYVPGLESVDARGSKEVMKKSFDQNAHNYRAVMAELKLKLQEKRAE